MEDLNKTQIILLTLLVSFVTSIATGIVTVTLLEQAPQGVTQTINKVVERTIERVVPGENQQTTVITKEIITKEEDLIIAAIEENTKSLVNFVTLDDEGVASSVGIGFIISSDGLAVVGKDVLAGEYNLQAQYAGVALSVEEIGVGHKDFSLVRLTPLEVFEEDAEGEMVGETPAVAYLSARLTGGPTAALGQTVISLEGAVNPLVSIGIISRLAEETTGGEEEGSVAEDITYIHTNITASATQVGGPLINTDGNVIGVVVTNKEGSSLVAVSAGDIARALVDATSITEESEENLTTEN